MVSALLLLSQLAAFYNPPIIPAWDAWAGGPPLFFCISSEMEPARQEVKAALDKWSEASGLTFLETKNCTMIRTLTFRLGACGGMRGSALYPPPLFPEPHAGDIYIDYNWPFSIKEAAPFMEALLLHEIGHAIGLGHSQLVEDVMYPLAITPSKPLSFRERKMVACLYRGLCY